MRIGNSQNELADRLPITKNESGHTLRLLPTETLIGNVRLLLWIMIAIWLGCAMLLPLYVLFKALFRSDLQHRTQAARILRA